MDGQIDLRTEFPPCVLQDIVPYRVRCPKRDKKGEGRRKKSKRGDEGANWKAALRVKIVQNGRI